MNPELIVSKIVQPVDNIDRLSEILDRENIEWHSITSCNWHDEYPYIPRVDFRIAHTGSAILINYRCREDFVRAVADADNGAVWEDSCVEFFLSPDGKKYYNIECNCAGTLLCGVGEGREQRRHCAPEILSKAVRKSTFDESVFPNRTAPEKWELSLILPVEILFDNDITDLSGLNATGNFYKCGDKLPIPHFLSWSPILTAKPDFHRPEFFGNLKFQ